MKGAVSDQYDVTSNTRSTPNCTNRGEAVRVDGKTNKQIINDECPAVSRYICQRQRAQRQQVHWCGTQQQTNTHNVKRQLARPPEATVVTRWAVTCGAQTKGRRPIWPIGAKRQSRKTIRNAEARGVTRKIRQCQLKGKWAILSDRCADAQRLSHEPHCGQWKGKRVPGVHLNANAERKADDDVQSPTPDTFGVGAAGGLYSRFTVRPELNS